MTITGVRTLRVGVAGLGFGATVHAPVLLAQPGVELVGIAGRSAERAQAAADTLGIAHGCASVDALLDLGLDAITLALPPDQTATAVRAALQRGIAVLCEKPLGTDAKTAVELAKLAEGRVTAMDFIFGELETFIRLKQLIDSGKFGTVRHAQVLWLTESWAYRSRNWSWKTDAMQGGGVISLFGTHLLYLAEWLLGPGASAQAYIGKPIAECFAPVGSIAAEDLVQCRMTHCNGALFMATFGNANPGIAIHRWTVVFEHGTAVLENIGTDYAAGFTLTLHSASGEQESVREPFSDSDGRLPPFSRLVQRFMEGVRTGQPVYPDLAAGARVQMLDAALHASASSGMESVLE